LQHCKINISDQNDLTIEDLKQAQVDGSGSLDPWKTKNPNLSHSLDETRYFFNTFFGEIAAFVEL
jgi:phage terminase large subunit-like protein